MNNEVLIRLTDAVPDGEFQFGEAVNIELHQGETLIICGPNGSGKSTLVDMLRGKRRLRQGQRETSDKLSISYASFIDQYSTGVDVGGSAYQMRWNRGAMDENFEPRVRDVLKGYQGYALMDFDSMMERTIVSLSSGEFRRLQLAKILAKNPNVVIIDNPFIGLDRQGRHAVSTLLKRLAERHDIAIVLTTCHWQESFSSPEPIANNCKPTSTSHKVLEAHNISIRYGKRTILNNFNLTIHEGEHWALKGPNGSGKSTLLSLICADNPQGYACDITLFGRGRGTGESIWDIKKNIGFVSPEMYRAYRRNLPVRDIIASGLYDTTGLFRRPKACDYATIAQWMETFNISQWSDRSYLCLSGGEQRWVLLCRAFVKNPPLLILDEPFHGLDPCYRSRAKQIICEYFRQAQRTLIMVSHYEEDFPPIIDHEINLRKQSTESEKLSTYDYNQQINS